MKLKVLAAWMMMFSFTLLSSGSLAQTTKATEVDEWVEEQAPPPPAFSKEHLIPIDLPLHMTVKVGVDPNSIVVGSDGVVRYVLVITNTTGTTSALYEGIRCISDEVKTYARLGSSGTWTMLTSQTWKPVSDNLPAGISLAFARQGGCQNRLATSKSEIITALTARMRVAPSMRSQ
jgi:hypothetical protein